MRRYTPVIITGLVFAFVDAFVLYGTYLLHKGEYAPVELSAAAPTVTWKAFDDTTHQLKDMQGHPVALHFWASWCGPCREEFPKILKAAEANPDMMFVLISSDEKREKAENFIKAIPDISGVRKPAANVFYAWDPHKDITYDQFFTARYPETIFIDRTLHMRRKIPGPVAWDNPTTVTLIQELREAK